MVAKDPQFRPHPRLDQDVPLPFPVEATTVTRGDSGENSGRRTPKATPAGRGQCPICGQRVKIIDGTRHSVLDVHYRTMTRGHRMACRASAVMICVATPTDPDPAALVCVCRRPKPWWTTAPTALSVPVPPIPSPLEDTR